MPRSFGRVMASAVLAASMAAATFGDETAAPSAAGYWRGTISLAGVQLGIEVSLDAADGTWTGKINIPAQGIRQLALERVRVEGETLAFAVPRIPGEPSFSGKLAADGATIQGDFSQSGQAFPFSLKRSEAPPADLPDPYADWIADGTPGEGVVGDWLGMIESGPARFRLALHVAANPEGGLRGTLDVVDQGAEGLALDRVELVERRLTFTMNAIGMSYAGTLDARGATIEGQWTQGPTSLPVLLKRRPAAP